MDEEKIVILKDEDGKAARFAQIMTFEFNENLYVAITPETQVDGIESGEVMLLQIREDEDGTDCYLPLENEQMLKQVWEEFEELYDEE
ncbi:MAG: DUF1292 domain-containing protein [Clostridia bacterium]|jgi:uncharacterized protein YrzB (UPF0473 family)|nr:DUF1292 domain-containing protein [Clostridia bacterium]